MKIFITGANGFVGTNLIDFLDSSYDIVKYNRDLNFDAFEDVVIHLAGKASDTKNISNPQEYYEVNTELTKNAFDAFLKSEAKVFITLSSIKAAADAADVPITENYVPNPVTHYGKSKLLAEQYINSKEIPIGKRVYILRPSMIYGAGNKGNLNLLYKLVSKGIPWPFGAFNNQRSFCSINNMCFVINELLNRKDIPSGVYNVADDETISTNEVICLIAQSQNKLPKILKINPILIKTIFKIGDFLRLPINSEKLQKLTDSYVVSNEKIKKAIGKDFPTTTNLGLLNTFELFAH